MPTCFSDVTKSLDPFDSDKNKLLFFDESTYYSNLVKSREINKIIRIFDDDRVMKGSQLLNPRLTDDNRTFECTLDKGKIIQDLTIFTTETDQIDLKIEVFKKYPILTFNTMENYFVVHGDVTHRFNIESPDFAIFNSVHNLNNHPNWIVKDSCFDIMANTTTIWTAQNISCFDEDGYIVKDHFPSPTMSSDGKLIVCSKYQYIETVTDNRLSIGIKFQNDAPFSWDHNVYRIVFGLFDIVKDFSTFQIRSFEKDESEMMVIEGKEYSLGYLSKVLDYVDGGTI